MYRECLLGVALSAALEEISAKHTLTQDEKEHLWRIFDETMDNCVSEAPLMSRINIKVATFRNSEAVVERTHRSSHLSTLVTDEHAPGGESTEMSAMRALETQSTSLPLASESSWQVEDEETTAFPVYRMIDGLWTILLKDPIVQVRDEFGAETEMKLDYLKVYLKDPARQRRPRRRRV